MRRKLVVGNWKMNGSRARNKALLADVVGRVPAGVEAAVCVPFPYLAEVGSLITGGDLTLGAQNLCEFDDGAYTGEVSAAMLIDLGVRYVIVGHSERRALFGESDLTVGRKARIALAAGLVPIVCIGETLAEREAGRVEAVLERQLAAVELECGAVGLGAIVLAYEPVWAIGTGRTATVSQVESVLGYLRGWLCPRLADAAQVTILYGGSVKPDSAGDLFSLPDCDGGLIGGASLDASAFLKICTAAAAAMHSGQG